MARIGHSETGAGWIRGYFPNLLAPFEPRREIFIESSLDYFLKYFNEGNVAFIFNCDNEPKLSFTKIDQMKGKLGTLSFQNS